MATPTKWGKEFRVNTTTKEFQGEPTITGIADGRFVVAWTDQSGGAVRAQVFNADGSKAGGEFRVNKTTDDQAAPTITALADGCFVVAWHDRSETGGDTSKTAVRGQIFNGDGSKSGGDFLVNTTTKKAQVTPTITALADGGFVVAWMDLSTAGDTSGWVVRAQIFNGDGNKFRGEFLVKSTTDNGQSEPTITGLADGRFVVAWTDWSETEPFDVTRALHPRGQIFNADGSKSGGEFQVNTPTTNNQWHPTITGLTDGRFVVAWTDETVDPLTQPRDVLAQVFNADGSKSGGNFQVNTSTGDLHWMPVVTALADGRFVVAWIDGSKTGGDKHGTAVRAQVFNADGTKSGGEFLVNTTTLKHQSEPTITALADGRFVVAWSDSGDKSGTAVRGQVFDPREEAVDLDGSDRDDQFVGTRFDDIINGGDGNDWLLGEKGKDLLAGGERKDKLKGGGGADQFVFGEIGKKHADKLIDFKPGKDLVVIDGDIFTGIGNKLGKTQFEIGKEADDGMDRVIYDKDKGKLSWDGDGKGGDKKVLFAKVDPGLKLSHDDFFMV